MHYALSPEERNNLLSAAEEFKTSYKIQTGNAGVPKRRAAMMFARSFDEMDKDTAMKILELLNKKKSEVE